MSDASLGAPRDARIAIVGAGHAGGRVAQHLRALGHRGEIALIGDEAHAPYERPALSKELLLGEKTPADLTLAPAGFWEDNTQTSACATPTRRYRARARRVFADPLGEHRAIELDDANSTRVDFDTLVVATGGKARMPRIDGIDQPGVHSLRTIDDCLALREALAGARDIVIIGAGVIGMEVAAAAAKLGKHATVLETAARPMARILPPPVSDWLAGVHRAHGVTIETGGAVTHIERTAARRFAVHVDGVSGAHTCDLVLVAAGIECSVDFLEGTSIASVDGIVVDACCRSPVAPWCYAAGDIAVAYNGRFGRMLRQETWRNAENQARAVAGFICGRVEPFNETPWMWTDQFGFNIQVIGRPEANHRFVTRGDIGAGPATLVALDGDYVSGAVLIDCGRNRRALEALIEAKTPVDRARLADAAVPLKEVAR